MEISATNDDGEYSLGVVEQVAHTVRKPRLFSRVQTSCLMSYYESGMKGTGEQYRALHERAAEETGLHVKQVVNWIKKRNYTQKHPRKGKKIDVPVAKRLKATTSWHQHLKTYGASERGRSKMHSEGVAAFMKAASESYKSLDPQEKQLLESGASSSTTSTVGDVIKQGRKHFSKVQQLFKELGELGYSCVAFGFFEGDVAIASTSDYMDIISPRCLEYIRALPIAAKPPPLPQPQPPQPQPPQLGAPL